MTHMTKQELTKTTKPRYLKADKKGKSKIRPTERIWKVPRQNSHFQTGLKVFTKRYLVFGYGGLSGGRQI